MNNLVSYCIKQLNVFNVRNVWLVLFITVLQVPSGFAQDPHFSQYYASPVYMNPAFVGSSNQQRVILNNRLQWPTLPQAFNTYAFSYDFARPTLRSGFGLLFSTDKAGETSMRATNIGAIYSYKIQMADKWVLTPAVYFGYGGRSLNYNQIVFGDQLEFGNNAAPTVDPVAGELENINYFDSGAGLLFYNQKSWLGASFWHLNQPNISFLERQDRIPMKMTFHAGTQIVVDRGWTKRNNVSYVTLSAIYSYQGPFRQMDLGVNYHVDPIVIGVSYRGIPWNNNYVGNMSRDAIVFASGLRFKQLNFMYSYDFTISELSVRSQGAHEISLEYRFDARLNPKRVPKSMKILPCPNYIPYDNFKMRRK